MEKRFILFVVLSVGAMFALMGVQALVSQWTRQPAEKNVAQNAGAEEGGPKAAENEKPEGPEGGAKPGEEEKPGGTAKPGENEPAKPGENETGEPKPGENNVGENEPPEAPPNPPPGPLGVPEQKWLALGSANPNGPYSSLYTFTNRGAALERVELNDPQYRDVENEGGYFGHLALVTAGEGGCRVNVVGPGTPAALAGIQVGDELVALDGFVLRNVATLNHRIKLTRPGQQVRFTVRRTGEDGAAKELELPVKLVHRPQEVIRPEPLDHNVQPIESGLHEPLSMLLTIGALPRKSTTRPMKALERLESANWKMERTSDGHGVEFSLGPDEGLDKQALAAIGLSGELKIVIRYRLQPASEADLKAGKPKPYHVNLEVELQNVGSEPINDLGYRLNGPNGLPTEGWWYSYKVQPDWGTAGARDVIYRTNATQQTWSSYVFTTCYTIYDNAVSNKEKPADIPLVKFEGKSPQDARTVLYAGVDSQYFSAVVIPGTLKDRGAVFSRLELAPVDTNDLPEKSHFKLTNVSFDLTSEPIDLEPGKSFSQSYVLFAGPKDPDLLARYELSNFVYYGWFGVISQPLVKVLHFFHWATGGFSYGLAIILLTLLVRGCMFPVSRKAVRNALMMQALAPEMKAITEKYKTDMEKRGKAQRELFAKYKYNPFGGCLLMFLQLPIFLGLYRALCVDLALRGAPLIPGLSWCSNLAAPDMLFKWEGWWDYFTSPTGWLGPYFNILPLFTVVLFMVQQKLFTPPPTDEQQKMSQNMMMWMTLFIGLMFFKVPSGLCLYFITSSLWGVLERKVFPKPKLPAELEKKAAQAAQAAKAAKDGGSVKPGPNGAPRQSRLKKEKGRK